MIGTFKEKPNGGYYCSECRMSFAEPEPFCPYCGSLISNCEELIVRANPDINPESYGTLYAEDSVAELARIVDFGETANMTMPQKHEWFQRNQDKLSELWNAMLKKASEELVDNLVDIRDVKVGDKV